MESTLQIIFESDGKRAVMYLRGRLSIQSSPELRERLLAVLIAQSPPATLVIDFEQVAYMDTSGIATLIEGLKIARLGGISMHIQGLEGRLLHLFQATGIGSLFDGGIAANRLPVAAGVP